MLVLERLEKVKKLPGRTVARCPACAEFGADKSGEHLVIFGDQKFGCCAHPKDHDHRSRIFALAGEKSNLPQVRKRVVMPPLKRPQHAAKGKIISKVQIPPADPIKLPQTTKEPEPTTKTPNLGRQGRIFPTCQNPEWKSRTVLSVAEAREVVNWRPCRPSDPKVTASLERNSSSLRAWESIAERIVRGDQTLTQPGGSFRESLRIGLRSCNTPMTTEALQFLP